MAEERLIDDDKDRKYKIVKNEDGEEELVIDTAPEEEAAEEELGFEVPELDSDDEEAAVMTPEQLAARDKMREEEAAKNKQRLEELAAQAAAMLEEKKYEDAVYVLDKAEGLGDDGAIYALRLRAYTQDFTDFSKPEEGVEAAEGVKNFASEELKEGLKTALPALNVRAEELKNEVETLNAENEEKKDGRRVIFRRKRNVSALAFLGACVPLIVFAALAIYFGTHMTAVKGGGNIPLFITFVTLAGVFFVATVIAARFLSKNASVLKLNEKNSSTKLGRKVEEKKAELNLVENILGIFAENDIS